jgi:hypothetical protein
MERYNPIIDNYVLSIPSEPYEEWRNNLQLLYDSMKLTVTDFIGIDGQYFDMHDEFSDSREDNFNVSEGMVIVGIRRLVYASFIPKFLELHLQFLEAVNSLPPDAKIDGRVRLKTAQEILKSYGGIILGIHEIDKREKLDLEEILEGVPNEFGLRRVIKRAFSAYQTYIECLRYPRCRLPTEDFPAAFGDYVIFRDLTESLAPEELVFLPADHPYYEDLYPGCLDSYRARLRFVTEVLTNTNLICFRENKMMGLLRGRNGS